MSLFMYTPYLCGLSGAGDTISRKYDILPRWLAGFYLFGWGGGGIRPRHYYLLCAFIGLIRRIIG